MPQAPSPAPRAGAALRLHGPGAPQGAQLLSVRGEERLDALYRLELEFLCPAAGFDPDALLYASAAVGLPCGDGRARWVGGSLGQLQLEAGPAGTVLCRAVLEPRLAALRVRRRSRVLRELSVVGLVRTLLGELGLSEGEDFVLSDELLETELQRPYGTRAARPRHRVLVQESESDYAFLARWLEREGVGMCFVASESGRERVVFFAGALAAGELELPAGEELGLRTTRSPLPRAILVLPNGQRDDGVCASLAGDPRGRAEDLLPDAHWRTERQARLLAEQRLEELRCASTRYQGRALEGALRPGLVVRSGEHRLRVTRVCYDYLVGSELPFALEWEAESGAVPHRPLRQTPWPASASTASALAARAAAAAEDLPGASAAAPRAEPASAAARPSAPHATSARAAAAAVASVAARASGPSPTRENSSRVDDCAPVALNPPSEDTAPRRELELAGTLPGPGLGSPEEEGEGEPSEEADDRYERDIGDPTGDELWSDWLDDYETAKSNSAWKGEWKKMSRGEFEADFLKVMAPTGSFDGFEKSCTAFEGGYGGGYSVGVGPSMELSYGDSGSYSEGVFSGEISSFATTHSISNIGIADEILNVANSMSVTNALLTNEVSNVGAASSLSTVLLSTETSNVLMSNVMSTVGVANEINHVLMSNAITEVGMSSEISNVGMVNAVSNVGLSTEMSTVAVAHSILMGGMANSISMVALSNEIAMGDTTSVVLGSSVDLSLAPAAVSMFLGATQVDLALCTKVEAWIGAGVSVEIAAKVDCFIGAVVDICLGYKCEIVAGYGEEIGTMKNSLALTDKWSAIAQFLGI